MFRKMKEGEVRKAIKKKAEDRDYKVLKGMMEKMPILRKLVTHLLKPEVLLPKEFYDKMVRDVINAEEEEDIVIYSPFTHKARVYDVISNLKRSKGKVTIYTQSPNQIKEDVQRKRHEESIELLKNIGATVYTKERMHEKAVIIGDRIAYFGSLNVLSRLGEEEGGDYMLRYENPLVASLIEDFVKEIESE